jgi:hypothetical protein
MNSADNLSLDELKKSAISITGDSTIVASGIFAVQDDYKKLFRGSFWSRSFLGAIYLVEAQNKQRMKLAQQLGYDSYRLVLAASAENIYVISLDLNKLYHSIERDSVRVTVKKFGMSRHILIENQQTKETFKFMGGTSPLSSVAPGDKAVIEAIS